MDDSKELTAARMALNQYIDTHGMRKTPERFAILERVFATSGHFDIDRLYTIMCDCDCRVSRATVYNTVQLFVDAGLVRKHRFGNATAQYERVNCVSTASHHHLVCRICGKVREMRDSEAIRTLEQRRYSGFKADYVALYVYGVCSGCRRKLRDKRHRQTPV